MNTSLKCVVCSSSRLSKYAAAVTPFLVERASIHGMQRRLLLHCRECGVAFFDPPFKEEEMTSIYRNYRDVLYQSRRQYYEPWYTAEVNAVLGNGREIELRIRNMESMVEKYLDFADIRAVLDYGGDRGQFIPTRIKSQIKHVFDVSGVPTLPNVQRVTREQLEKATAVYDLTMCCHVLEHVSEPARIVADLARLTAHGKYLYIEVPYDSPFPERDVVVLPIKYKLKIAAKMIISTFTVVRPFFYMHEHVNFFTSESLERLVVLAGLDMVARHVAVVDLGWTTMRTLAILACKKA